MTDRDLLELAAKAAGIAGAWGRNRFIGGHEGFVPKGWLRDWDPLTDDGDALRLAVALRMEVDVYYGEVASGEEGERNQTLIDATPDLYAATRRAIVRAAAAIGESMGCAS